MQHPGKEKIAALASSDALNVGVLITGCLGCCQTCLHYAVCTLVDVNESNPWALMPQYGV